MRICNPQHPLMQLIIACHADDADYKSAPQLRRIANPAWRGAIIKERNDEHTPRYTSRPGPPHGNIRCGTPLYGKDRESEPESPEKRTVGTFCFVPSPDPNYAHNEDGAWLDDKPYHVIHRIASDGSEKGIFQACINWCTSRDSNLRADTHADNKVMQHLLEQNGFIRCGIISSLTNGRFNFSPQSTQRHTEFL